VKTDKAYKVVENSRVGVEIMFINSFINMSIYRLIFAKMWGG